MALLIFALTSSMSVDCGSGRHLEQCDSVERIQTPQSHFFRSGFTVPQKSWTGTKMSAWITLFAFMVEVIVTL